jgi:hypothetical protein
MNPKSVVADFIGRTMTNLQMIFHFVNSHSSNRTMSSFVTVEGLLTPSSCVTLVPLFLLFFNAFMDAPLQQNAVPILCSESVAPDTPSKHKSPITEHCSSLLQTESGAAIINDKAAMTELA